MATKRSLLLLGVAAWLLCAAWKAFAQNADPENGVVLIELPGNAGRGAGIILTVRKAGNENEVLILTAYHLLQKFQDKQLDRVPLRFHGDPTRFNADIVDVDKWMDINDDMGVIRLRGRNVPNTARALPLGNLDSITEHTPVVAIGHRVDGGNEEWLSDDGRVAQPVGTTVTFSRTTADSGFSGGPLLNSKGDVIGMVTEANTSGGLGYAKSVDLIRAFLRGAGIVLAGIQIETIDPSWFGDYWTEHRDQLHEWVSWTLSIGVTALEKKQYVNLLYETGDDIGNSDTSHCSVTWRGAAQPGNDSDTVTFTAPRDSQTGDACSKLMPLSLSGTISRVGPNQLIVQGNRDPWDHEVLLRQR